MTDDLQQLKQMWVSNQQSTYPAFPVKYIPQPTYSDRTANGLTRCIIDYIRLRGGHAERVANMGRAIDMGAGVKWIKGQGMNGTADIHACIKGMFLAIEVKVGRDKMSDAQQQYRESVERSHGYYFVARSFTQIKGEIDIFF